MPTFLIDVLDNDSNAPAFIAGTTFSENRTTSGLVSRGGWSNGKYSTDDFELTVPYHNDSEASPLFLGSNYGIFKVTYYLPTEYILPGTDGEVKSPNYVIAFTVYNQAYPDGGKLPSYFQIPPSKVDEESQIHLELDLADNGLPNLKLL